MKIINPSIKIEDKINGQEILKKLERIGRTCYKSESNITSTSAENFIKNIIKSGHESVLEHVNISVRIICPRIISQMFERHRLASFSQESQRYCNYANDKFGNELTFIRPCWFTSSSEELNRGISSYEDEDCWIDSMIRAEGEYFKLLSMGWKAQEARSVLPNYVKTEFVMTCNLREWRHFMKLRTDKAAQLDIRVLANMILKEFKSKILVVFDDIEVIK